MSKMPGIFLLSLSLLILGNAANAADSYGESLALKAGSGFSNMALGWLEVPKNMINTSNDVNLAFGITGGLFKGVLHTLGRTLTGAVDVLTAPLPTKPIVAPSFVWERFDVETHYNPAFKLKD